MALIVAFAHRRVAFRRGLVAVGHGTRRSFSRSAVQSRAELAPDLKSNPRQRPKWRDPSAYEPGELLKQCDVRGRASPRTRSAFVEQAVTRAMVPSVVVVHATWILLAWSVLAH